MRTATIHFNLTIRAEDEEKLQAAIDTMMARLKDAGIVAVISRNDSSHISAYE